MKTASAPSTLNSSRHNLRWITGARRICGARRSWEEIGAGRRPGEIRSLYSNPPHCCSPLVIRISGFLVLEAAQAAGAAVITWSRVMLASHNWLQKGNVNQTAKLSKAFRRKFKDRRRFPCSPSMHRCLSYLGDRRRGKIADETLYNGMTE